MKKVKSAILMMSLACFVGLVVAGCAQTASDTMDGSMDKQMENMQNDPKANNMDKAMETMDREKMDEGMKNNMEHEMK